MQTSKQTSKQKSGFYTQTAPPQNISIVIKKTIFELVETESGGAWWTCARTGSYVDPEIHVGLFDSLSQLGVDRGSLPN